MAVYNAGSAAVRIRPDASGFAADLRDDLQRIQVEYDVDVHADLTRFRQQLNGLNETVRVDVDVDTASAQAQLAALSGQSVNVQIDLQGADAAELNRIAAALQALNAVGDVVLRVDILGDASQMQAAARLKGLAKELERLRLIGNVTTRVDIQGDADQMTAAGKLKGVARDLERLQALGSVRCRIDLDVRGGAELLAVIAALRNLRDRRFNVTADTNSAQRGVSSLMSSLTSMGALKFTGLISAIGAIAPALLGAAGAAGGLTAVLGAIGGTGALGISGLSDTFSAIKDQSASAGDAAQEMADKQQAVTEAAQAQESAQRDLADAQQTAKDAQKDLTDSYEDARRALRDMNDELVDATLNQEEAEIALAEAQQERNKTYSDPTASGLDRAKADLRVDKAEQRLKESRSDVSDKKKDTAEANAKGIEGSDQVTAAKKNKADADQSVIDAQNKLATAAYNLSKAQKDLASGSDASDKVAQAMAKLAPSAQDFVRQMQALGPAWTDMRKAVQEKLFDGLGDSVTRFAQTNLPGLKAGLSEVAGYMNGAFKQTLSGLSTEFANLQASGQWQGLINAAGSALSGMAPMITGLTNALVTMGAAVGPALGPFFTQLGELIRTLGPALGQLGATLLTSLTAIAPTLGQFLTALATGLGPVLPVLATLINSLGQALIPLIPPLSQVVQIIGNTLAQILPVVAPFFAQLVQLAADLLAAVTPLLPPLLQLASAILTPLVGVLQSVVGALAPFIQQIAEFMGPVIEKITPLLQQMGDEIGQGLADAITQLMPSFLDFAEAISGLEQQFLPLLPDLARIAADLLPLMLTQLELILPVATKFIIAFSDIVERIMPYLIAGLDMVADGIEWFSGKVSEFVTAWTTAWDGISLKADDVAKWLRGKFDEIVGFVSGLKERVKTAASDAWEGLKDSFRSLINWIFSTWNNLKLTVSVLGKSVSIDTPDIPLLQKAGGGPIVGAGGPRDDIIPILGSNGEYMIQASSVDKYGVDFFDRINAGRFETGGLLGATHASAKNDFDRVGKDRWNTIWSRFFEDKAGSNNPGPRDTFLAAHPELQRQYREGYLPPGADLYAQPDWKERLKLAKQRDGQSGAPSGTPDPSGTPAPSGTPSPSTTPPPTGTPSTTAAAGQPYGLDEKANSGGFGGGAIDFPDWVDAIASKFGVKPSTYPGHQTGEGSGGAAYGYTPNPQHLNRGIDWTGSTAQLEALATWLMQTAPSQKGLEQVIWWNPETGRKAGWAGRKDVTNEAYYEYPQGYPDHRDHVHTRFVESISVNPVAAPMNTPNDPNANGGNPYANPDNRDGPQKYTPDGTGSGTKSDYPTTISGWAGLAASGFTSGFVSDALGVLGIPDSPSFITGMKDLSSQVRIKDPKTGKTIWGTYTPPTTTNPNANGNNGNQNQNQNQTNPQNPAPGSTNLTGVGSLTTSSPPLDVAKAIIGEAKKGGYSATDAVAELSTAIQESGLVPTAQGGGGLWHGIYQQDSGYPGRDDPNQNIAEFFKRLGAKKSSGGWSSDIWKNIFWLQQRPGEVSADVAFANGRQAYLTEIQSQRGKAQGMFDQITGGVYDVGGVLPHGAFALNTSGHDEYVIPNEILQRAVSALQPQRQLATAGAAPASGRGGPGYRDHIEYHIQTARVEDAYYQARQREDTRAAASINRY